jgi:hypothetical protein
VITRDAISTALGLSGSGMGGPSIMGISAATGFGPREYWGIGGNNMVGAGLKASLSSKSPTWFRWLSELAQNASLFGFMLLARSSFELMWSSS